MRLNQTIRPMSTPQYNQQAIHQRKITLYTEANPNPNSMKFMFSFMLVAEGRTFDFPDAEAAKTSPLAQALFARFDYLERVFYMSNFITLTKRDDADWNAIIPALKAYLLEYFEAGKPLFHEAPEEAADAIREDDSEAVKKIKMVLDEYIKPAVESDGGAITFQSFEPESGQVRVILQGSCSGCPSSTVTLKAGIENLLKRMVPTVKEVVAEAQ